MLKQLNNREMVVDTSPLLLLLIGLFDRKLIEKFKKTKEFKLIDFELLFQYIRGKKITITPEILAEVSDFAEELGNERFSEFIKMNIEQLKKIGEVYISKEDMLTEENLKIVLKLGFTDTSLLLLAKRNNAEVITNDFRLWNRCNDLGIKSTHLNAIISEKEHLL